MTRTPVKLALILVACACLTYFIVPALAQSTLIKVDVLQNGDARWTTEKMVSLDTPDDVAAWDATAARGTDSYRDDFKSRMEAYVARISADTGRTMSVRDVNVSVEKSNPYALSDNGSVTYGVIRYEFTWTGFAMASGDALEIGDAFVDGYLMNDGDSLTFTLPSGYNIESISPTSDDLKKGLQPQVRWTFSASNGSDIRLFPSGEPSIIMKKVAAPAAGLEWWMLIPVILVSAAAGFGAAYLIFRRKSPKTPPKVPAVADRMPPLPDLTPLPDAGAEEIEELPAPGDERFLSDEEKIIMFLEEAGGQMFQSDLVKKTDFSKSKLSMVLSDLKEKGVILKIKKGKENLIRLNRPSSGKQDGTSDQE